MKRTVFLSLLFAAFLPALYADVSVHWHGAPEIVSRAAAVMDAATGTFVFLHNADMEIQPASLTKLMTMHLVFQEISAGRAALDEIIVPPPESWAINQFPGSSLMFLAPGQQVSLEDLLLGLAIPSGNDAAVAVALRFAPSVDAFAQMMNREARAMGLSRTRFVEPSGISDYNMTTAREFAYFSRHYIHLWPESLANYHTVREFSFPRAEHVANAFRDNPGTITQRNRNTLLGRVDGVDGIRTGFINASGFNISLTAERDGTRFIAVVLGAPSEPGGDRIRDEDGERLLEWAFSRYHTVRPRLDAPLAPVRVWRGRQNHVDVALLEPLDFTAGIGRGENMRWRIEPQERLSAPLEIGSHAGSLVLTDSFGELRRIPLVTAASVEQGGFFRRLFDSIRLFFMR
ncbi:MAG: D-alanyl-D-alanine carboxypeptidase [Treponema sp.]|jgi:D-alanyl-D-alanine carboxypeptidase (penicillin-binding protein 5/6)|nr:D-alanyl-D-alanine carboxypeptidase [Treponema sp.]